MNEIGIVSIDFKASLAPTIFPNPAKNQLSIVFSEKRKIKDLKIFVYNGLGQLVLAQNGYNLLSVSSLDAGFYTVVILGNGLVWRKPLIKN